MAKKNINFLWQQKTCIKHLPTQYITLKLYPGNIPSIFIGHVLAALLLL